MILVGQVSTFPDSQFCVQPSQERQQPIYEMAVKIDFRCWSPYSLCSAPRQFTQTLPQTRQHRWDLRLISYWSKGLKNKGQSLDFSATVIIIIAQRPPSAAYGAPVDVAKYLPPRQAHKLSLVSHQLLSCTADLFTRVEAATESNTCTSTSCPPLRYLPLQRSQRAVSSRKYSTRRQRSFRMSETQPLDF